MPQREVFKKKKKIKLKFFQKDLFVEELSSMAVASWFAAQRRSLSSRKTNQRQNQTRPTTAATPAGSIGRVSEGGARPSNDGAPGSDGDPKATQTTRRRRRMRRKRMK